VWPPLQHAGALSNYPLYDRTTTNSTSIPNRSWISPCRNSGRRADLRWHYRSRHESLIAIPSPIGEAARLGVQYAVVVNGYDKSSVNPNEAALRSHQFKMGHRRLNVLFTRARNMSMGVKHICLRI
jgi:hypothetical protein